MNGAHFISFFMMNFARGSASKIIRRSRNGWCFGATSTSPVGTGPHGRLLDAAVMLTYTGAQYALVRGAQIRGAPGAAR